MSPSFNLLHEPWIPVALSAGDQREVGLAEALARAHEIRALAEPSPLVMVSLLRLMLAVLHRLYGPAREVAWDALWQAGRLDEASLAAYWSGVEDRFDLFDAKRPFMQSAGLPATAGGPVAKLTLCHASGRQATLFDHRLDETGAGVPPAQAARWLLAHHNFCLSGCCGDGHGLRGVPAGPLTNMALFLPQGQTLLQTLLLNLVPYDPHADVPIPADDDAPAWEQETAPASAELPRGYLDLLTWQPRQVLLLPEPRGREVSRAVVMPGRVANPRRLACDPMVGYRADRTSPGAWTPLRWRPDDGGWQAAARALRPSTATWRQPLVLQALAHRVARGAAPPGSRLSLTAVGLAADRARVEQVRRHDAVLPVEALRDASLLADLELAWRAAEQSATVLSRTLAEAGAGNRGSRDGGFGGAMGMRLRALPQRLTGGTEERGDGLRSWAGACLREASGAWAVGIESAPRRRDTWRRQAELGEQLGRALGAELGSLLGGDR